MATMKHCLWVFVGDFPGDRTCSSWVNVQMDFNAFNGLYLYLQLVLGVVGAWVILIVLRVVFSSWASLGALVSY